MRLRRSRARIPQGFRSGESLSAARLWARSFPLARLIEMKATIPTISSMLAVLGTLCCFALPSVAQSSNQVCPISIEHLELGYAHRGSVSSPELIAIFSNTTGSRIATARFELSQLGAGGYPHSYPNILTYQVGVNAHKRTRYAWDLDPEAVDIHRTGQSLLLLSVGFDDRTIWKDDGSESCVLTVDYHGR
jgi:hypothetical protein